MVHCIAKLKETIKKYFTIAKLKNNTNYIQIAIMITIEKFCNFKAESHPKTIRSNAIINNEYTNAHANIYRDL